MLQEELSINKALEMYLKGREVLLMYNETLEADKPVYTVESLKAALERYRFLVDVPAVENPDFEQVSEDDVQAATMQQADTARVEDTAKLQQEWKTLQNCNRRMDKCPKPARKKLDIGKVMALKDAGWTYEQIADEMGSTKGSMAQAVYAYKKQQKNKG